MNANEEVVVWIIGQIVVAAAIWGAIRADLKAMHHLVGLALKNADKAHERIDGILHDRRTSDEPLYRRP